MLTNWTFSLYHSIYTVLGNSSVDSLTIAVDADDDDHKMSELKGKL